MNNSQISKNVLAAIILSAMVLFTTFAPAEAKAQTSQELEFCDLFAASAASTMKARQAGSPIENQLRIARESGAALERMIFDAYEAPIVQGRDNKAALVSEFETRYYIACVRLMVSR